MVRATNRSAQECKDNLGASYITFPLRAAVLHLLRKLGFFGQLSALRLILVAECFEVGLEGFDNLRPLLALILSAFKEVVSEDLGSGLVPLSSNCACEIELELICGTARSTVVAPDLS